MASLGQTFDAEAVPPSDRNFELLPQAWYLAQIIESEVVATKTGGRMAKFTWEILEGPASNRRVWQNINIENNSEKAQAIGQRELADICQATGIGSTDDTEDLHFKPCNVLIGIEEAKGGYEAKNRVKRVKEVGSGAERPQEGYQRTAPAAARTAPAAAPAQRQAAPARAGTPARPWAKPPF